MKHLTALPVAALLLARPALAQLAATFAPAVTYSSGTSGRPFGIAVADVNGDGKLNVLTANAYTNTVGVLLGTGTGSFGAVSTFSTGAGSNPNSVAVADVNSDDVPDVLTANGGTNTMAVLLGTGTGSFGSPSTFSTGVGSSPLSIAVVDVNGDGQLDVLTANYGTSTVGVLLGTGLGSFGSPSTFSTGVGSYLNNLAVADVNLDGKPDALTANYSGRSVGVLLGTGTGAFGAVTTYSTGASNLPTGVAVADVNSDGLPDLLTTNYTNNTAGVLLGTGMGSFGALATYDTGINSGPMRVAVADVNGDGKLDLVTANGTVATAGVLLGTGTGTFGTVTPYSTSLGSMAADVRVADVNGDGRPDLLTANSGINSVGVLLNTTPKILPTRAALPGTSATLHPNPATTAATLMATGLPAAATQLAATLTDALGRPVRRLLVPATAGAATATVPTTELAAGLYLLQLEAQDAQGAVLGALSAQRLGVE